MVWTHGKVMCMCDYAVDLNTVLDYMFDAWLLYVYVLEFTTHHYHYYIQAPKAGILRDIWLWKSGIMG